MKTHDPATASSRARIRQLLPMALIAAGVALGTPAIAQADRNQDISDYFACLVEHTSGEYVDEVTDETCCILHNGKMVNGHCDLILESAQPAAPAGKRVLSDHRDLADAPVVTTVPTKTPSMTLGR